MNAPDGGHPALQRIVGGALEADRAGFGHAIGDGDVAHVHRFVDAPHHLDRAGRAGHDAGAQRRRGRIWEIGVVEFGDEHGRHAVERRAFFLLDGLQRRQRIESLAGIDHGCARGDGGEIAHHHAEAMIERNRNADAVLLGQAHRAADEIAVVEDVVMRQRDALGRSGGAAGELDVDGIVELQGLGQRGERVAVARAAHARRPPRTRSCPATAGPPIWITARNCGSRAACRSPGVRFRKLGQQRVQHLHVVGGLERGRRDDRGASDLGEREFEFAQAVGGVDGDEDEPGLGGGELRQRPFRPVQRPDADPRAAFEAEREKARGQRIDALGEFLPGPPDIMAWRNQRLAIGPALRGQIEAAPDGVAEQRRIGDAANITGCYFGQSLFLHASKHDARPIMGYNPMRLVFPARPDRSRRKRIGVLRRLLRPHRARHRRRARSRQRLPGTSCRRTATTASGSRRRRCAPDRSRNRCWRGPPRRGCRGCGLPASWRC